MDKAKNSRIAWIDVAKAIAIFFVMVAHSSREPYMDLALLGMYFAVQLFFFLSGMFARPEKHGLWEYIKRQATVFMVPYCAFSVINLAFYLFFNRNTGKDEIIRIIINMVLARRNQVLVASMWFLPCIFAVSILYKIISMAIKNVRARFVVCTFIALFARVYMQEPMLPFTVNQALRFLFYYAAGGILYPHIKNIGFKRSFIDKPVYVKAILTVYFVVCVCMMVRLYEKGYVFRVPSDNMFLMIPLNILYSIISISFIMMVSVLLEWCLPLAEIGKNTLGLCCMENINNTLLNVAMTVVGVGFIPNSPAKVILYNSMTITIGCAILFFINRYCPVILGKRKGK